MTDDDSNTTEVNGMLDVSPRLRMLPVIHGSVDMAIRVREELLERRPACVAVPLPATWQPHVMELVEELPQPGAVVQEVGDTETATFVPVDPCQPVIAALRFARRDRIPVEFVDLETADFTPVSTLLPDPYALRTLPLEKFLAAVLPTLQRPKPDSLHDRRARRMAFELHRLELDYDRVLFLPNILDWPWVREAYVERRPYPPHETYFSPFQLVGVDPSTLAFFLGELPFVTALFERARLTLDADEHVAIDAVKELLLVARDRWRGEQPAGGGDWIGPKLLQTYLQYARNLTLLHRRLSPDMYTLVLAAKQVGGDAFARAVLETARDYPLELPPPDRPRLRMGLGRADLPGQGVFEMKSRLPGLEGEWRTLELRPAPKPTDKRRWKQLWDPLGQCSWPPEDEKIESFQTHVREQAKALLGNDLVRTEKFTTSVKDGIDIRETIRNWHTGDLYVKEVPPARGSIDAVVMLFDVPADPDRYAWRSTWMAEHQNESTIAFFATAFSDNVIGPGVAESRYGGVMFLYPPRMMPDVWSDYRLPQAGTLEERLLRGACFHAKERHVALVSPVPPKLAWHRAAKRYGKKLVHLPLSKFSGRTVDRLRTFHVLNGKEVRSYAAHYIREG